MTVAEAGVAGRRRRIAAGAERPVLDRRTAGARPAPVHRLSLGVSRVLHPNSPAKGCTTMAIEVGDKAPDFELKDNHGAHRAALRLPGREERGPALLPLRLHRRLHRRAVRAARRAAAVRQTDDTQLLAVSNDSIHTLRVFAEQEGLEYPLLSDFWPHGEVSARVRRLRRGEGLRGARHLRHRQGGRRALDRRQRPAGRPRPERVRRRRSTPCDPGSSAPGDRSRQSLRREPLTRIDTLIRYRRTTGRTAPLQRTQWRTRGSQPQQGRQRLADQGGART